MKSEITFRILEIPQAQHFIRNHPFLKITIYTQDTVLFYSLTIPTLLQYNALDSTIALLLENLIIDQYNLVQVYRIFNLGTITHGKHLRCVLHKYVYKTS